MSLLLLYVSQNCKSFPFIPFQTLFKQEINVLISCLYSSGSALDIQHFEIDIVEATQPPSVDTF